MKLTRVLLFTTVLSTLCGSTLRAEYLFLKDGSIIKGTVESETPKGTIVRLPTGKSMTINPKDVLRTLYTELYMGQIHIQKVDGSTIDAYMVDEDQQSITFRKDINKPEEFILKREDIFFTTRKNPVGLEGKAETDQIILKWKPPYTKAQEYNVYIKSDKDYILAGKSKSPDYVVKGVKSNTLYLVKVTATDQEGIETLPSNEIKIKTMNIQPEPPKNVRVELIPGENNTCTVLITWDAGLSVDGKIKGYRILEKDGTEFRDAGFTTKNELELKHLDAGKSYFFAIRTVDVNGWESDNSRIVNTLSLKVYISPTLSFIMPLGKFKDIAKSGYGGMLQIVRPDFPFYNFETGIAFGYWQFNGAGEVKASSWIPALVVLGYRFNYLSITFIPRIEVGYGLNSIKYSEYTSNAQSQKNATGFEPLLMGGMMVNIAATNRFSIFIGADGGSVIERKSIFPFASFNGGVMMKF